MQKKIELTPIFFSLFFVHCLHNYRDIINYDHELLLLGWQDKLHRLFGWGVRSKQMRD